MRKYLLPATAILILTSACADSTRPPASSWAANNPDWIAAIEPFRVYDNIYFVGARGLSSFLIVTPDGHFLIDGALPESASMIARNIGMLGFDIRDVKILLNSHAHIDHSGGLAELKKLSGAEMIASEGDRWALETGLVPGSEDDPDYAAPPVKVDRTISDGGTLTLGAVTLTAHLTPGHTRGCTTWTMQAAGKSVLFFCSATVAANRLVNPPQYEGIVEDYRSTFAKMRTWRPDIFLANHPVFFSMEEKRARQVAGDKDAFVDPDGFPALAAGLETAFERSLAEQSAKASKG